MWQDTLEEQPDFVLAAIVARIGRVAVSHPNLTLRALIRKRWHKLGRSFQARSAKRRYYNRHKWIHYNEELQIYNTTYNTKAGFIDTVNLSQPQKNMGLLKAGARARVIGEWLVIPGENQAIFLALKVAIDDFGRK